MGKVFRAALSLALMLAPAAIQARPYHHYAHSAGSGEYYTAHSGHQVHRSVHASRAPAGGYSSLPGRDVQL